MNPDRPSFRASRDPAPAAAAAAPDDTDMQILNDAESVVQNALIFLNVSEEVDDFLRTHPRRNGIFYWISDEREYNELLRRQQAARREWWTSVVRPRDMPDFPSAQEEYQYLIQLQYAARREWWTRLSIREVMRRYRDRLLEVKRRHDSLRGDIEWILFLLELAHVWEGVNERVDRPNRDISFAEAAAEYREMINAYNALVVARASLILSEETRVRTFLYLSHIQAKLRRYADSYERQERERTRFSNSAFTTPFQPLLL